MTQLICQALQLVGVKVVVVPQHVVVAGPTCSLNALVATQVEVKLCRVRNSHINGGACRNVARLAGLLLLVGAEQPEQKNIRSENAYLFTLEDLGF